MSDFLKMAIMQVSELLSSVTAQHGTCPFGSLQKEKKKFLSALHTCQKESEILLRFRRLQLSRDESDPSRSQDRQVGAGFLPKSLCLNVKLVATLTRYCCVFWKEPILHGIGD